MSAKTKRILITTECHEVLVIRFTSNEARDSDRPKCDLISLTPDTAAVTSTSGPNMRWPASARPEITQDEGEQE